MPTVYVAAKFSLKVDLSSIEGGDYFLGEWTNNKLAKSREEYGQANLHFSLEHKNENEDFLHMITPTISELYEGIFNFEQHESIFVFHCDAKFKSSAHKFVKAAVDAGAIFRVEAIAVNGAAVSMQNSLEATVNISNKKL